LQGRRKNPHQKPLTHRINIYPERLVWIAHASKALRISQV